MRRSAGIVGGRKRANKLRANLCQGLPHIRIHNRRGYSIRLSPRDPFIGIWYFRVGQAHLLQSRIDEAILWFEKARSANPRLPFVRAFLASAYALKGGSERAAAELAEARRLVGGDLFSSITRLKAHPGAWSGVPKTRAL